MDLTSVVTVGAQLAIGFLASVAGIALWAHTRQPAWVLVILATLVGYVGVLLQFLGILGVINLDFWTLDGVAILRLAIGVGSPLFYAVGLFLALRSFLKP
jgi:high-affinity Fe2+/Pb2+ permease